MKTLSVGFGLLLASTYLVGDSVSSGPHPGGNDREVRFAAEKVAETPSGTEATRSALSRALTLKSPEAIEACTSLKGTVVFGVTISSYLGDSGSCSSFDATYGELYADFYLVNGTAGQRLHISELSSSFNGLATIQDYSAGTVLASCSSLSTSCVFDYVVPATGKYILGVAAYGYGYYTAVVSSTSSSGSSNLVPYKPTGWSDRIVVTRTDPCGTDPSCPTPATLIDSSAINSNDTLFITYAVDNSGTGDISAAAMSADVDSLYIDGVKFTDWQYSWTDALPGGYWYWSNVTGTSTNPLRLSAGSHTLQIRLDTTNAVAESSESDNIYTKTLVVAAATAPAGCGAAGSACLNDRFKVTVGWVANGTSGAGTPVAITGDSAYFWFFGANAAELMVKVVDGRAVNGKFWFFYGALSDVLYAITVVDTQTGLSKTYTNPQGHLGSVADTAAF